MKIGLFFGSFNPVHNGHLMIANYFLEFSDLEKIWFVISPQNPFKERASLLADTHRYALLNEAIGVSAKYFVSDIEFTMPKPSFTIDTLTYLQEKYPEHEFVLIMGGDNLQNFHKWKNHDKILENHAIYVYPRSETETSKFGNHSKITKIFAPKIEISSSFIRQSIKEKKDLRFYMPEKAYTYMREMHFYEKK